MLFDTKPPQALKNSAAKVQAMDHYDSSREPHEFKGFFLGEV